MFPFKPLGNPSTTSNVKVQEIEEETGKIVELTNAPLTVDPQHPQPLVVSQTANAVQQSLQIPLIEASAVAPMMLAKAAIHLKGYINSRSPAAKEITPSLKNILFTSYKIRNVASEVISAQLQISLNVTHIAQQFERCVRPGQLPPPAMMTAFANQYKQWITQYLDPINATVQSLSGDLQRDFNQIVELIMTQDGANAYMDDFRRIQDRIQTLNNERAILVNTLANNQVAREQAAIQLVGLEAQREILSARCNGHVKSEAEMAKIHTRTLEEGQNRLRQMSEERKKTSTYTRSYVFGLFKSRTTITEPYSTRDLNNEAERMQAISQSQLKLLDEANAGREKLQSHLSSVQGSITGLHEAEKKATAAIPAAQKQLEEVDKQLEQESQQLALFHEVQREIERRYMIQGQTLTAFLARLAEMPRVCMQFDGQHPVKTLWSNFYDMCKWHAECIADPSFFPTIFPGIAADAQLRLQNYQPIVEELSQLWSGKIPLELLNTLNDSDKALLGTQLPPNADQIAAITA